METDVALADVHDSVDAFPDVIDVGLAVNVHVADGGATVMLAVHVVVNPVVPTAVPV